MAQPDNDGNIIKRTSQYLDNLEHDDVTGGKGVAIYGTDGGGVYRAKVNPTGTLDVNIASGSSSGTEYTDAATAPGNPAGGTITWNDSGTMRAVSTAKPLPVTATVSTAGLATDTNQTNGNQKTKITDGTNTLDVVVESNTFGDVKKGLLMHGRETGTGASAVVHSLITDSSGNLKVSEINQVNTIGTAASAIPSKLVQVGGSDGTNARAIKTNTSGQLDVRPLTSSDQITTVPSGTQTVSGTVTANIGTSGSLALDATLTGGTQKTKLVDSGGTNVATVSAAGAVKVDGSAVTQPVSGTFWQATQPVSGTVTANAGTNLNTSLLALDSTLTGGTQKAIARGGAKGTTTAADITSNPIDANTQALHVDGSKVTQPVSGTITANAGTNLNTSALALDTTLTGGTQQSKITDGTNVASVKAASTAAIATDKAVVVAVSPNNTVGVTGTFWQTTQPVSGPLTDTQLRASAVPVSLSSTTLTGTSDVNITKINGTAANTAAAGTILVGVADAAGSGITSNSTTYTAKKGLDGNLLGTLGTAFSTAGKVDVKGADGDVFVRQATAGNLLATVNNRDGSGNALTSNSTTYTAKFGLDNNLLGTLGTAFSTPGKVDVKGTDGDVFVRQATGTNLHTVVDSGSITATQATGTNLHTVVDSGSITATQATGSNLHTVVDSGTITTVGAVTNITNAIPVNTTTTSTQTSVANSITSVTLLASNTSRKSATIYNDDTAANLYVKFGTTASTTSFKIKIAPGGYYEFPLPIYTGRVDGIASAATGSARICEET